LLPLLFSRRPRVRAHWQALARLDAASDDMDLATADDSRDDSDQDSWAT